MTGVLAQWLPVFYIPNCATLHLQPSVLHVPHTSPVHAAIAACIQAHFCLTTSFLKCSIAQTQINAANSTCSS